MKSSPIAFMVLCALLALPSPAGAHSKAPRHSLWVTGYYASWDSNRLRPEDIDLRPLTHVVYFALWPTADGQAVDTRGGFSDADADALARVVHAAGKKVLICVGGANSASVFRPAIATAQRGAFVASIAAWVKLHAYDGVDVDMEPVESADGPDFQAFVRALRTALVADNPQALVTAAVAGTPGPYLPVVDQLDQVNVMTYAWSGPWQGWVTWYDGSLYAPPTAVKADNTPLPSVDAAVKSWLTAGVQPARLGIGIAFYGEIWTGATGPNQSIQGVTSTELRYDDIMEKYYSNDRYHWDESASAPYLSVSGAGPADNHFISYDDERSCGAKVRYAQKGGLGGVIIWELGDGYRPFEPAGQRNPLLAAINDALH
ncbi:MAG: glycoside hydrolase family 18 protein [Capsulimonadaceae bacterium]